MQLKIRLLAALLAVGALEQIAPGQTKLSTATQTKDVDYSNAGYTKPFRSGTVLPAACSQGEAFNLASALPGTSLYLCAPANQWTQVAGTSVPASAGQSGAVLSNDGANAVWIRLGGDVSGSPGAMAVQRLRGVLIAPGTPLNGQALVFNSVLNQWEPGTGGTVQDWPVTRTGDTTITVGPGPGVRMGNTYCRTPAANATINVGGGTGAIYLFIRSTCELVAATTINISSCTNCTAVAGSAFEDNSFPLAQWNVTAGILDSAGVHTVTPYGVQPLLAGQNIQLTRTGGETQINAPNLASNHPVRMIGYSFDLGGTALAPSVTKYLTVPFGCTLSGWNINVDQGSVTIRILKSPTGTGVPSVANSITTNGLGISGSTSVHSRDMSDFTTTTVTANDVIGFNLSSALAATFANVILECVQ